MTSKLEQELLDLAKQMQFHCNLLIEQCNNWLPPPDYEKLRQAKQCASGMNTWKVLFPTKESKSDNTELKNNNDKP